MEELKTYLKPWFQHVIWGILGSSHDNKHLSFSQKQEAACWGKPDLVEARIHRAAECFPIVLQLLAGRQPEEMVAWIYRSSQGPNFHMETNGGM